MTFAQAQKYFDTIADFTSDCSFVSSKKLIVISMLNFQHFISWRTAGAKTSSNEQVIENQGSPKLEISGRRPPLQF